MQVDTIEILCAPHAVAQSLVQTDLILKPLQDTRNCRK